MVEKVSNWVSEWARRWRRGANTAVDGASLAVFRILFGTILCVGSIRFIAEGWVDVLFGQPNVFLHHYAFPFLSPLSADGMLAIECGLALLAALIATGTFTRLAFLLFGLGFSYVQLCDVTNYLNHYYLVMWLCALGVVLPTERTWSVDAWWRSRRGRPLPTTVPAIAIWLLRFQIAIVYIFAAVAKAQPDWLLAGQPMGLWLAARSHYPVIGPLFAMGETALVASWLGFLYDATIVLWLSMRRTRPMAYAAVVGFHVMTATLFDIGLFPPLMIAATLIFFSPNWPRRIVDRLLRVPALAHPVTRPITNKSPLPWLATSAAIAFVVFHVVMPLRFLVYPTPTSWGEEGMRWSWRVMVREKNAAVTYKVVQRSTGREWQVNPQTFLTWRQANEVMPQPDLILQTAHLVAKELRERGHGDVAVFADAQAALNGRPMARLIDPSVDLTTIDDGVLPATYILDAPSSPALKAVRR